MTVFERGPLRGTVAVPGDKSISHRALMLSAASTGCSVARELNLGGDVRSTRDALVALGVSIDVDGTTATIAGGSLRSPSETLDARNSATTARLLMGLCAGRGVCARFDGDASLRRRPMERVARPLRMLDVEVETSDGRLPADVRPNEATRRRLADPGAREYALEVASAQVKSAILLANLDAAGIVRITGDRGTRDHTERMLCHFGRTVRWDGKTIELEPGRLGSADVHVPGDLSAAAFFLGAGAITPGSDLRITGVGVNPTRTGVIEALHAMGADVALENEREQSGEPVAALRVRYRQLHATDVAGDLVVRAIDEIPVLAVVAAHAQGTTRIRDAAELRRKESDRLSALVAILRACGVAVTEFDDGLDIVGGTAVLPERALCTHGDHRIAMAIAALAAPTGLHEIDDAGSIDVSFPGFTDLWPSVQRARL